ncbi:MAG TPA: O-antigen ligase family protein, partial [Oligoflexia bacterium]|nr:O-antigen ligase family protein [Oligoflexia bacterium]
AHFLFLLILFLVGMACYRSTTSLEFAFKYLSSFSGLIFIPWAFEQLTKVSRPERSNFELFKWLTLLSITAVILGVLLQAAGLVPWRSYDLIPPSYFGHAFAEEPLKKVWRLTGFYYHPLDLIRVLVWPYFFLVLLASRLPENRRTVPILLFAGMHLIFIGNTHRMTLFFLLTSTVFLFWYLGSAKFSAYGLLIVLVSWLIGILLFSAVHRTNFSHIFAPSQFINVPKLALKFNYRLKSITTDPPVLNAPIVPAIPLEKQQIITLRGRGYFWKNHFNRTLEFSAAEWLFGTSKAFIGSPNSPDGVWNDSQPHSQVLDALARFGVIGLLLILAFYIYVFGFQFKLGPIAGSLALGTLAWYGIFTEVLIMPTFSWWALLFVWFVSKPNLLCARNLTFKRLD